jgi:hypothetical protein
MMAIMPHCVVCGFSSGSTVAGSVEFADYNPGWQPPTNADGFQVLGWCNELGVTAPDGVGLFCHEHLKRARRLRRQPAIQAVQTMASGADLHGTPLGWLRRLFR